MKRLRQHWSLIVLLILFCGLAGYQSVVLPLGEADDETDHYQYLRFVARAGRPPLTEIERNEAGFKGGLAPLYYWLTAWPVAWVGESTLPDIRRVDARSQRHIPTDGLGINHVLHTLDEGWPWRGQTLAWHLVRFLSVLMGVVTVVATYLLARMIFKPKLIAFGAAAFVALLPRFVFSSAAINDDNLVFALIALLLVVQTVLLKRQQHRSGWLLAVLGLLFGLALVTKYFSLILLPEIVFSVAVLFRADTIHRTIGGRIMRFWPLLLALFLTAGLWFIYIVWQFNRVAELGWIAGLAASLGEPQVTEGLVGLFSGQSTRAAVTTYNLVEWFGFLYRSFWFEFGWMQVFAPPWVYLLFTLFSILALTGLILVRFRVTTEGIPTWVRQPDQLPDNVATTDLSGFFSAGKNLVQRQIFYLLSLHIGLFLAVVLARYVLSATIDTGQGRHLFPVLPVIAILVALGLYQFAWVISKLFPGQRWVFKATCLFLGAPFLLAALACLWPELTDGEFGSRYVTAAYHTHPVTITPPAIPEDRRLDIPVTQDFSLAGYSAPERANAGNALPVTLIWATARSALPHDFLVSLCLVDDADQPAGCWQGHFEDGRYPARAWEAGDIIVDTIHIPLPVCDRPEAQLYTLRLKVWQLQNESPTPQPTGAPLLDHAFNHRGITINPTNTSVGQIQAGELWTGDLNLTKSTEIQYLQSLSYLSYNTTEAKQYPLLSHTKTGSVWLPEEPATTLYLACDRLLTGDHTQVAQFVANPTLPAGQYNTGPTTPPIQLSQRQRQLTPINTTLTFSQTLAPLNLKIKDQSLATGSGQAVGDNLRIEHPSNTPLPVTIVWQSHRWMAEPIIIAIKLIDQAFQVGGERLATLGGRYPNVLWVPSEVIEESYLVQPAPDAAPGLYRLEVGLIRQDEKLPGGYDNLPLMDGDTVLGDNLYPLTVRMLDPEHKTPPPFPVSAQVGNSIQLTGYDISDQYQRPLGENAVLKSDTLQLALYWQSTTKIDQDLTVFTQLVGPDGQVWAQWDNPPQGGRYPTTAWLQQDEVVDRYTLTLNQGAPDGDYQLLVGMYNPTTGERLPVSKNGFPQPNNAILLLPVTVVGE
jgi:4-amino-4-deoxy-L-arabinose transferase-like glycosyltransferase